MHFYRGDLQSLDSNHGELFDVVFSRIVLQHLNDPLSGRETRMGVKLPSHFIADGIGAPDGTDVGDACCRWPRLLK